MRNIFTQKNKNKRETYNITIKLCGVNFEEEKKLNCLILINLK
jgi:hypothetical protein